MSESTEDPYPIKPHGIYYENQGERYIHVDDPKVSMPEWIDEEILTDVTDRYIDLQTVSGIAEHGCASGMYMPAVLYHDAAETMTEHGNDIVAYVDHVRSERCDEPMVIPAGTSWDGIAVLYVSSAVEYWCDDLVATIDCSWKRDLTPLRVTKTGAKSDA